MNHSTSTIYNMLLNCKIAMYVLFSVYIIVHMYQHCTNSACVVQVGKKYADILESCFVLVNEHNTP